MRPGASVRRSRHVLRHSARVDIGARKYDAPVHTLFVELAALARILFSLGLCRKFVAIGA
jgi:hypothetical protein